MPNTVLFSLGNLVGLSRHGGDILGPHPLQVRRHLLHKWPSRNAPLGRFAASNPGRQHRAAKVAVTTAGSHYSSMLEPRRWWWLSRPVIGPQCPHHTLKLRLELHVISLPAGEVGGQPGFDLLRLAACPLEYKTVKARLCPLPFTLPCAGQEMEHCLKAEDIAIQTKTEDDPI
jgi:hypothetical protein